MKPRRKSLKFEAPAVVQKWKRFIVCGCSHGLMVDDAAASCLLKFRDDYKPDATIHLGDWMDTTAFRAGAKGTKDEGADIDEDMLAGLQFLERLKPTVVFNGNHEQRAWEKQDAPRADTAKAAQDVVKNCTKFIRDNLKARYVDTYTITESWLWLGPYKLGHGWMFSESAIRDHADFAGDCIIAHLHRYGVERGRRLNGATGICVGMMADGRRLSYANRNKSKAKWTTSFLYGEYSDTALIHHPYIIQESAPVTFGRI